MRRFGIRKERPLLGVDISSSAIKVLELGREGSGYRVDSYGVAPLPQDAGGDQALAEPERVGEILAKILETARCRSREAAIAVPQSAVITKILSLPGHLEGQELEGQVFLEAAQHIPYPLEEVNLDFEVRGRAQDKDGRQEVLLVATRRENVESRVAVLESAGLTPRVVDVEPFAVEKAFALVSEQLPNGGRDATVAVMDIGATVTTIDVIRNGESLYTREQAFGGRRLTDEIMRKYGLSFEEAGLAKKMGGLPADYEADLLQPFRQTMAQQLHRSLQFFFSSTPHNAVDHVVLAGGCAAIPGAAAVIQEQLRVPTTVANPFYNMVIAPTVRPDALRRDVPSLMVACGLAMRSFAE